MERRRTIRIAVAAFGALFVIVLVMFLLQLPFLSPRKLIIGERVLGGGQFCILEALAGMVSSLIITIAAAVLAKDLMVWIAVLSSTIQIIWLAFTETYLLPLNSAAEFTFRAAEPLGVIVGAAIAVLIARGITSYRRRPMNDNV